MSSQLLDFPYKHSSSILSFADNTLTAVREAILTAGYGPMTNLAEKAVVSYVFHLSCHTCCIFHWPLLLLALAF